VAVHRCLVSWWYKRVKFPPLSLSHGCKIFGVGLYETYYIRRYKSSIFHHGCHIQCEYYSYKQLTWFIRRKCFLYKIMLHNILHYVSS
jgi:hypothetical protein